MKNKIGWCSMTFNPVWGCLNHCEYCYARIFAKRFWKRMYMNEANHQWKEHPGWAWTGDHLSGLKSFKPTFLNAQFEKKFPKKSQRIFVGSMSEIYYWDEAWIERVIEKVKQYPQHTFMFLTKFPEVYQNWIFPNNCWLGVTITHGREAYNLYEPFFYLKVNNIRFISVEPMFEYIPIDCIDFADWIIIGEETGNRKGKIIPKREWIEKMVNQLRFKNIPIYLKDSLKNIYPEEIKEFFRR